LRGISVYLECLIVTPIAGTYSDQVAMLLGILLPIT